MVKLIFVVDVMLFKVVFKSGINQFFLGYECGMLY